jgi:RNA polymerase sigma-70 factor (ECF subfamily)
VIELAPPSRPDVDDDALLLLRAAAGDWDCIGTLYDRHRDSALAVATSVLADPVDAEDVVHDVFMDLPRMARTYDPGRGRPEQWLCRSVRNRAIDHVRRRSRRQSRIAPTLDGPESLLALVPSRAASPVEEVEAAEFLDLVGRLDARYAHLVRLAFVDGWSHSAIANLTGIPLGTVKTRLRNSMRQIREMLGTPPSTTPRVPAIGTASLGPAIVTITGDPRLAAEIGRSARGIAPSRRLSAASGSAGVGVDAGDTPGAVVLDFSSRAVEHSAVLERLADRSWADVPLLVRVDGGEVPGLPSRRGLTLVLEAPDAPRIGLAEAVPAVLSASSDAGQRARAAARLLRADLAFVVGDRLGRVTTVTRQAATLLGRAPRQLHGSFVTDLGAAPIADAERQWQALVSAGQWTGRSVIRRPDGAPVPLVASVWMVPDGGFAAVIARDERAVESAA